MRLTAGEHAHLRRLPQPLISAVGSDLRQTYTVELAATSRFVLREEQLLVVDPLLDVRRDAVLLGEGTKNGCAVLAPLAGGPALLATTIAPTTSTLRELLDEAHARALTR
ncbi:urease accessory protein UreD [Streptomyces yerevanensis]|uniref:urease accessory protein UreD n=1 Tax=Streptomyces yerevanensis TaxID=66378 RepID=UPI00068DC957|nr:urease accessory protein UreD [Streptomyces yerevanensis]